MTIKEKGGVNEGVLGENSAENTVDGTKGGRSIDTGRLKTGSSNEVIATEVLVVINIVASWVWFTPLIGARRVEIFLSELFSWSISGGWRETAIKIHQFQDPSECYTFNNFENSGTTHYSHTRNRQLCL